MAHGLWFARLRSPKLLLVALKAGLPDTPILLPGLGRDLPPSAATTNMKPPLVSTIPAPELCPFCGLIGPRHGSDTECIAALRAQVAHLIGFVVSRTRQVA